MRMGDVVLTDGARSGLAHALTEAVEAMDALREIAEGD